jgi:hypothetical protein
VVVAGSARDSNGVSIWAVLLFFALVAAAAALAFLR